MSSSFSVGQSDIGRDSQQGTELDGQGESQTPYLSEGTSWRLLLERSIARSRKIRGSNYVQLATVDSDNGAPKCRCVVFRGFVPLPTDHPMHNACDNLPCAMKMITDLRSQKVSQVTHQSLSEMVWWFPKTSEQYRVTGHIVLVGGEQTTQVELPFHSDKTLASARKEMWNNCSDAARESFLSQLVPGDPWLPTVDGEGSSVPPGARDPDGKLLPPPENFLLMLLLPIKVDYLRLNNMYRQIDHLDDCGAWSSQRVNP